MMQFAGRIALLLGTLFLLAFGPFSTLQAAPEDLPNFHQVSPGIYRGGAPTEAGLKRLKSMGIRTVIDLRISPRRVAEEKKFAQKLGFTWLNLPMGSDPPTSKQVTQFLSTLKNASAQSPVFVHCQHGCDRTGCMFGIWRVTQHNWTFDQTWKEMRRYGFNPHWKKLSQAVRERAPR